MEKLLTAQQVADHFGWHIKTLQRLLRENKIALRFIKLTGKTIAFRPSDVEAYISQHEILRDGRGAKKAPRRKTKARMMTDQEAQEFFAGVKTVDGVLESSGNEIVN